MNGYGAVPSKVADDACHCPLSQRTKRGSTVLCGLCGRLKMRRQ